MRSSAVPAVWPASILNHDPAGNDALTTTPDDPVPTPRAGTSTPPEPPEAPADLGTRLLEQIPSGLSPKIAEHFIALCEASEQRGEPAIHCRGPRCTPNGCCDCQCWGCTRAVVFLMRAQRSLISRDGEATS